jgi:predicted transcriptional regulator YheO
MGILTAPKTANEQAAVNENYSNTVGDLVRSAFVNVQSKISPMTGMSPVEKGRRIIQKLHELGIFEIKSAVDIVASELGVSKYTIYNYLREAKNEGARADGETVGT